MYQRLGEHDKALSEALEAVRLGPTAVGYHEVFQENLNLNRLNEARAEAARQLLAALREKARTDTQAQKAIEQLKAGTGEAGVKDFPSDIKIEDIVRNREVAQKLGMTEGSVKWYMQQVYDKIGTRRRLQAVERARQFGVIA